MGRWLRLGAIALLALVVLALAGIVAMVGVRPFVGPRARPLTGLTVEATPERVERGRYLALSVNGCVYCHSETDWQSPGFPPRAGTEGGGKSFADEGVPFLSAPNITPDRESGVGAWTDDMLARAIREGISHDGRALFPMMPYPQYRFMSDEDVASIIAYLRTLKPLPGGPPPTAVPFPVNRLINGVPEPITAPIPQPDRSNQVAYGDYMVRLSGCRDCHTPMDEQGTMVPDMEFAGGLTIVGPYGRVWSANITQAPSGIPYYTEDLFLEMMRTGVVRSRDLHDAMPVVVYGKQTDEDLKAMFAYLKTIPPVQHRVDNTLPATACPRCGLQHGAGDQNQPVGN